MNWTPVSEAMPEPGEFVIVYVQKVYGDKTRRLRAQYAPPKTFPVHPDHAGDFGEYDEATDETYCPEGWYETNEFEEVNWRIAGEVTHWMPMPEPPGADVTDATTALCEMTSLLREQTHNALEASQKHHAAEQRIRFMEQSACASCRRKWVDLEPPGEASDAVCQAEEVSRG